SSPLGGTPKLSEERARLGVLSPVYYFPITPKQVWGCHLSVRRVWLTTGHPNVPLRRGVPRSGGGCKGRKAQHRGAGSATTANTRTRRSVCPTPDCGGDRGGARRGARRRRSRR